MTALSNSYDTIANPISPPSAEKPKRRWIRPVLIGSGMLIAFLLGVGGTNADLAATDNADTSAGLARAEQQRDQAKAELKDTKAAASAMQDELDALQAQEAELDVLQAQEADVAAREDDVAARESELDQRQADLDAQEAALVEQGQALEPAPPAEPADECHPSYEPCVPIASDVDCAGGSGNGPVYTGRVSVIGPDEYDLDRDGDGVACDA